MPVLMTASYIEVSMKIWNKVPAGKRKIVGVDDVTDEEEDRIPDFAANYGAFFYNTAMGELEEDTEGYVVEDDLGQMLREAEEGCETEKESRDLKRMLEDYRTLLYPDCKQDQKKLGTTLELLQWKASNGLSDKGFEELLKLIKNLLPEGNTLPETTYEAKKNCLSFRIRGTEDRHRRYMLVLMTASYIEVSMKIWIHVLYAAHAGIRSLEMIQTTLRGCVSRRGCLPR